MTLDAQASARPRVALVIGAGSVKCAAAIGLQNVFQREGIPFDMVVGCSAGSLYASLLAVGFDTKTVVELTSRLWTREITSKRHMPSLLRSMAPRLLGFTQEFGLKDDSLIMDRLREAFGAREFKDTKIPLHIAATDLATGDQVVIASGSIVDAVRASIAIPFVFRPWPLGGRMLADGFLSDPLPVGIAIKEGADVIVAMGFESPYQTEILSPTRFAFQISSIMTNNLLKARYAFHNLAHHSEVIPIIPEFKQRIRLFDTGKIPYIIEEGERAAEAQLPYLRRLMAETRIAEA